MRCPKCAKLIAEISHECPYCHEKLSIENVTYKTLNRKNATGNDIQNNNLTYIFMFIPFGGLIYYLLNKDIYPLKSACAFRGFKFNSIIILLFLLLMFLVKIF